MSFVIISMQLKYAFDHVDGLVQGRRNSITNALELRLSYTNPSMFWTRENSSVITYHYNPQHTPAHVYFDWNMGAIDYNKL